MGIIIRWIASKIGICRKIPVHIAFEDIELILEHFPREKWKYMIAPLIYEKDKKNKVSYVYNNRKIIRDYSYDICYFELDNLEPGWTCPHDVGDYVTHKKLGGIYYIEHVGSLDSRYPSKVSHMVSFGNTYFVIGFNDEGKLIATNDIDRELTEDNSGYHMFESVKRPDIKPGEFFYYIEMERKGLIKQINDERPFENYILANKIKLKLGDTSHKDEYDRFFETVNVKE